MGKTGARGLLTVRQVAAYLAVSTATVYTLIEQGRLGHFRVSNAIRVGAEALSTYLAQAVDARDKRRDEPQPTRAQVENTAPHTEEARHA